jgi:hypothetical protein
MNNTKFKTDKDGSTCESGTKVILTSRLFDLLPCLEMDKLHDNPDFNMIVNTLYHELGHISDWKDYPKLYSVADAMDNVKNGLPAFLWLEYLAEKRSCQLNLVDNNSFCTQFVNYKWYPYKVSFEKANGTNFYYLSKAMMYFIGRTMKNNVRQEYLDKINDPILVDYINAIIQEFYRLESRMPFDDVTMLCDLYEIINTYYKKFRNKYKPRL